MDPQVATLNRKAGNPWIEVIIGQAQHATYRLLLWDENGHDSKSIGVGFNWGDIADRYDLGPAIDLRNKTISWEIYVFPAELGPGQLYAVKVVITQDGVAVPGGTFVETGPLDKSKMVYGARKFEAV